MKKQLLLSVTETYRNIALFYLLIGIVACWFLWLIARSTLRHYRRLKMQQQVIKEALEKKEVLDPEFLAERKKLLLLKADEANVDQRWRSVVKVYGVAVDWKEDNKRLFFAAFSNGKSVFIGETNDAFAPESHRETEIKDLVKVSAALKKHTQFTVDLSLPAENNYKFWLLTTDGVHSAVVNAGAMVEGNVWEVVWEKVREVKGEVVAR